MSFRNLAGYPNSTEIITEELRRCGIPYRRNNEPIGEPKAFVYGKFNNVTDQHSDFRFERAWCYYVITGNVPAAVARELYDDDVGRKDIRVNGNCTCPAPKDHQLMYYTPSGQRIIDSSNRSDFQKFAASVSPSIRKVGEEGLQKYIFSDDPARDAPGFVELYHIDSELGLYIFVQALKRHSLVL